MTDAIPLLPRGRKAERHAIIHDENEVHLRGKALQDVWWQGRQWAVTSRGIECRDGAYYIEAKRLCEAHNEVAPWSWIAALGDKPEWVDISDFATAFHVAVAMHGKCLTDRETDLLRGHYRRALGSAVAHQERQSVPEPQQTGIPICEIGDEDEGE
jgi:hypothetical protein